MTRKMIPTTVTRCAAAPSGTDGAVRSRGVRSAAGVARSVFTGRARAGAARGSPRTRCCRSTPGQRRLRPRAPRCRARGRMAGRARRLAARRRRAGRATALARREDRDRARGRLARRALRCAAVAARRHAARSSSPMAGRAAARYRGGSTLPLRPRHLQARLGARRPDPVDGAGGARAGTVHLGGTLEEIARRRGGGARGRASGRPFVLLVQASRFDPSRAPAGRHTGWAYCHVPHGSTRDMTAAIEAQVERFAPGFSRLILGGSAMDTADVERAQPEPRRRRHQRRRAGLGSCSRVRCPARPYATPLPGVFLCSSSTPPGGGVHGMCGYWAARTALTGAGGA